MKKKPSNKAIVRTRILVLLGVMGFVFGVVLIRLVTLQGLESPRWGRQAAREHERILDTKGERGKIYDRSGQPLAMNVQVPSIFAVPSLMQDPESTARRLAALLGEKSGPLVRRFREGKDFVWVQRKVDPARISSIEPVRSQGIGIVLESQRIYPKHLLLGQTLGFADIDNRGIEGIELEYDPVLQGEERTLTFERDARGKVVFPKGLVYDGAARGKDLYLTIDEVIQYVSERELDRAMEATRAESGTVIVMDPRTAEILALAVRPQFNPNARDPSRPEQWRNRAVTDIYEPGSTFKIVTASAALQEGVVFPEEEIFCENGSMPMAGRPLHDHKPSGWLSFEEVIAHSSNIGTAKVAMRLGANRLERYISKFGFGEKSGVDLPGEIPGMIPPISRRSDRSLAMHAIGQGVGVTPLQMVTAMAAIANGGYLMTPHVTMAIRSDEGRTLKSYAPHIRRRVISPETSRKMIGILEKVVSREGTGERAAIRGYRVAGKTGTAQKVDPLTGRYSRDRFVSSFVGFAPADSPRVVILVVIDEPKGVNWGGSVAAPVFKAIGEEALHHLGVPPVENPEMVLANARFTQE